MRLFRRKPPVPTKDEEIHRYSFDLQVATKARDAAFQRNLIQPTDDNKQRLDRLDVIVDNVQRILQKLTKEERQ